MSAVQQQARVTAHGDISAYAEAVWACLLAYAKRRGRAEVLDGVAGYRVRTTMKATARQALPALKLMAEADLETLLKDIRAVLRSTGNAKCTNQSSGHTEWWVSERYCAGVAVVTTLTRGPRGVGEGGRQDPKAEAEAKVTVHEAGEDRAPEAVVVSHVPEDELLPPDERVLALLKRERQPLSSAEIAHVIGDLKQPQTPHGRVAPRQPVAGRVATRTLKRLVNQGFVFRRFETLDERRLRAGMSSADVPAGRLGYLYSTSDPVPARTRRDVVGFALNAVTLPHDSGANANARIRADRNERVLSALLEAGRPVNVSALTDATGLNRRVVSRALDDLAEDGLAHNDKRDGRDWLPIDVPFPDKPTAVQSAQPRRNAHLLKRSGAFQAVATAAIELSGRPQGVTSTELHEVTKYSVSYCGDVLRELEGLVRIGTRHRCHVYCAIPPVASPPPAPPAQEDPVTVTATATAVERTPQVIIKELADTLGVSLGDPERVAELEARIRELEERLAVAQRKLTALTQV